MIARTPGARSEDAPSEPEQFPTLGTVSRTGTGTKRRCLEQVRTSKRSQAATEPAWSIPSLREPRYSQSLERGLAILSCFTPARPVLGHRRHRRPSRHEPLNDAPLRDHARRAGLPRAGRLAQVPPGPARDRPGDVGAQLDRPARALPPYLQELRQRTSYTVSLGGARRAGHPVTSTARASFRRAGEQDRPRPACRARDCRPTARRWASCCWRTCPTPQQRELFSEMKLTKRGSRTRSRARRRCATSSTRCERAGFAVNDEELAPGAVLDLRARAQRGAGGRRRDRTWRRHSSMISLEEMVDALGPHLVSTADRISARLGYRRDDERQPERERPAPAGGPRRCAGTLLAVRVA